MNIRHALVALGLVPFALGGCGPAGGSAGTTDGAPTPTGEIRVSGPHVHANLQVFLVHGPCRGAATG